MKHHSPQKHIQTQKRDPANNIDPIYFRKRTLKMPKRGEEGRGEGGAGAEAGDREGRKEGRRGFCFDSASIRNAIEANDASMSVLVFISLR